MRAEGLATDGSVLLPLSLVLAVLSFIYCASAAWSRVYRLGNYPVVDSSLLDIRVAYRHSQAFLVFAAASVLQQRSPGGSTIIAQNVNRKARFQMIAFMTEMKRQRQKKSTDNQSYGYLE